MFILFMLSVISAATECRILLNSKMAIKLERNRMAPMTTKPREIFFLIPIV